ncbi:MAG: hypothetical protein LBT90_00505 [Holosporaceae bacterium]|jgi:septal ring factor EnvC (AmiA/AmiB activator)|nr:hypothetical protein [Holosporaceae bacterium]
MLHRKKTESHITKFSIYSAALHGSLLLFCAASLRLPRQAPRLLVNIDVAGEEELRGYIEKYSQQQMSLSSSPSSPESSFAAAEDKFNPDEDTEVKEPLPENPEQQEKLEETQEQASKSTADGEDDSLVENPENILTTETQSPESPITEEKLSTQENTINDANRDDKKNTSQDDEPVPGEEYKQNSEKNENREQRDENSKTEKVEQKKIEKDKKLEQKKKEQLENKEKKIKKKNKAKKELLGIISEAEKAKKKNENRKKIQNIAQQMSEQNKIKERNKSNQTFRKMVSDSIKSIGSSNGSGNGGGFGEELSENEYNMISAQINPHWVVPYGIRGADSLIIEIRIKLKDNGEVIPSELMVMDEERYAADPAFRAAADGARRAILEASPLSLPPHKADLLREFIFAFDVGKASRK